MDSPALRLAAVLLLFDAGSSALRLQTDARTSAIGQYGRSRYQIEGVLDLISRFKSFTTTQSWKHGIAGPLWQRSSYDRVFDLAKVVEEVVEYTLDNPVRKQLAARWEDWPYAKLVDPWWE